MKRSLTLLFLFCCLISKAQNITARVIDSSTSKPLGYAIVIYEGRQRVLYTDISGYFTLNKDSLLQNDTIMVQFLGFQKAFVPVNNFKNGLVIKMIPEMQTLQPVIVTNCRNQVEFTLNKKIGRIKQYIGPGPETKLVIMSRYNNVTGHRGYIKRISILIDEKSPNLQIPIRLRWYDWDDEDQVPGKELTDTSIIVYPYKEGWNDFDLPANTIDCPKDWIVFGFEFIYPPEYALQYKSLKTDKERINWLSDMKHRWSLGMQYVSNEHESGYYIINNSDMNPYDKKYDRYFIRPAVRLTLVFCGD